MKWLTLLLAGLLALAQYLLWFGDGGLNDYWNLTAQVEDQRRENLRLHRRNENLAAEVRDLKSGLEAVEARARVELGMVKEDEVFYQVISISPADGTATTKSPDEP